MSAAEDVFFQFEGRRMRGRAGQSIGAALHAAGVRVLSTSFKYRRPRGLYCVAGACPNCAVRVDGLPGVPACTTVLIGGEEVERDGRWPWLGPVLDRSSPLLPAGFYFGRLLPRRPGPWRLAERVLAHVAGVSELPDARAASSVLSSALEEREVDVVVVGAGPTGLAAATAEARSGRSVVVIERDAAAGGSLLAEPGGAARADGLVAGAAAEKVELLLSAVAFGWYEEGVLAAVTGDRLFAFRPAHLVLATGTYERGVAFLDGDRPGVLLAKGAQRLLLRDGVLPGRRVVVATNEAYGHQVAVLLRDGGADVVVADRRSGAESEPDRVDPSIRVLSGRSPYAAHGRRVVEAVTLRGANGDLRLDCDAVAIAAGRRPADELLRMHTAPGPRRAEWVGAPNG